MRSYGFAVVGTGNIAAVHIAAIKQLPNAWVVGVTSRSSAQEVARKHCVKAYPDMDALLADDDVDVVTVCTPSGVHHEPAVAAARSGRHVIVEKPLEVTIGRARDIIEAADASGVKLATIFMSRFADANMRLKRVIEAGELGQLLQGDAYVKWHRSQEYYDSGDWRGTWRLDGGGALMNQAIHQVDLLLWLMGPVAEVFAYAGTLAHERLEVEDTLVAVLRYRSGALGHISAATSLWPGQPKALEIHGKRGTVRVRDDAVVGWQLEGLSKEEPADVVGDEGAASSSTFADPMAMSSENHRRQFEDFLTAVEEDRAPLVDGREGLRSVQLVEAIYRSVREGRPIRFEDEA